MDFREMAECLANHPKARTTLMSQTSSYVIDNMRVIRHPVEPGKPARFELEHEGRLLDCTNYNDWALAGRCLRMVDSKMANRTGIDAFQMWVNWSRQAFHAGAMADVDVPSMATMWASFKTAHRQKMDAAMTERMAEMLPEPPRMAVLPTDIPYARESVQLKMKRLHEEAIVPTFGTDGAACFDLYAITEFDGEAYINSTAMANVTVETGWAFEVPEGWVMKVYSRSGQGFKDNTRLANCVGIIDSDYRGPLRVKLTRDDGKMLFVRHGDRVAQAMLERVPVVEFVEVDELGSTDRGERGYGSTGR